MKTVTVSPQTISQFSRCYREAIKIWKMVYGIPEKLKEIENNDKIDREFETFKFFVIASHERSGKNPNFPIFHIKTLKLAMSGRKFKECVEKDEKFPSKVWNNFERLAKRPNKNCTEGPVKEILEKMHTEKEADIALFLGKKRMEEARNFLRKIKGIGDKLSAFILREFHREFGLWEKELEKNKGRYYHLQPVDIWVRRISKIVWKKELENSHDRAAKQIVWMCLENNVNPVEFNEGAWFLGSYFKEICFVCGISVEERSSTENNILNFLRGIEKCEIEIEDIRRKITNYFEYLKEKLIFPIRIS